MRAVQGAMTRMSSGWTCVALMAVSVFGAPAAAQQRSRCDSCAEAARAASRDAFEQARRQLDDATRALMRQRMALYDNDTSTAALKALREAERNLELAQRAYDTQAMEAIHAEAQARAAEARQAMQHVRELQQRMSRQIQREQQPQRGWLGIRFQSGTQGDARGHPVIVAVDPGSPAERAGLEAGDVLVTVDGRNMWPGTPAFDRILKPGTRLPLQVKRDGETKTLNIVVGRRPSFYAFRFNPDSFEVHIPDFDVAPMPPMPAMPSTPTAQSIVVLPSRPPLPVRAPSAPLTSFYFNGVSTIAGAQLWDVDQLKSYFHVDDGLLVLRVLPGTPADRAGLRSGDVIVRADGRTMTSIHTLESALERADERSTDQSAIHTAQLDVVRNGRRMGVALKW